MIVVVTGPIASGKTTLVQALARELRTSGRTAATLDRDEVYELLEERGKTAGNPETWRRANRLTTAFAQALAAEVDVVLVETDEAIDGALHVTLTTPLEVALERVQLDPTRGLSRDPTVLRSHYDVYATPSAELTIDTSQTTLAETVRVVAFELGSPSANRVRKDDPTLES